MGGLAGHMPHLHEDLSLTFGDIQRILEAVADVRVKKVNNTDDDEGLSTIGQPIEKFDGQNLFASKVNITVDENGELKIAINQTEDPELSSMVLAARNEGDIARGGMSPDQLYDKFKNHPAKAPFVNGFKAIESSLASMSPGAVDEIFDGGKRFMNLEIVYPKNPNMIIYDARSIVFHNLSTYESDPSRPGKFMTVKDPNSRELFNKFVNIVNNKEVEAENESWQIHGPTVVQLKKIDTVYFEKIKDELDKIAQSRNLSSGSTLEEYVRIGLQEKLETIGLPDPNRSRLIDRMIRVYMGEKIKSLPQELDVRQIKKGLSKNHQKIVSLFNKELKGQILAEVFPLDIAITEYAIEVLRGLRSFLIPTQESHDRELDSIKKDLAGAIKHLEAVRDESENESDVLRAKRLLDKHFSQKMGDDIEKIVSSLEGIVFEYPPGSDNIYKLTGSFAMLNQLVGGARRMGYPSRTIRESKEGDIYLEVLKEIACGVKDRKLYVDKKLGLDINQISLMSDFCNYACDFIPIVGNFKIYVVSQREPYNIRTTAHYDLQSGDVVVYGGDRALVDVLRSIAHELTHMMQKEKGLINGPIRDAGGFHEDQANARAGEVIKRFAQSLPDRLEIYR